MDGADEADHSEDNLGSAGSVGETRSPDSKVDDDDGASSDSDAGAADDDDGGATSASDLGLSSPGLSLSSLASPAILPSPSTSLASPCPLTPSPATPSSASYTTSGGGHDAIIGIIGKSSLITAQTSLSAASSSSSSSSSSGNGSTPGLPFGLYNMLPGPSPSGSGHSHHSVHHHHHHPQHPVGQHQQQNSHHHHQQQQQQQHHHHGLLLPPANLPHRHPIGTNPHDINNPLSVNQLTGQCSSNSNKDKAHSSVSKASDTNSHAIVSVTWWNHNSIHTVTYILFLLNFPASRIIFQTQRKSSTTVACAQGLIFKWDLTNNNNKGYFRLFATPPPLPPPELKNVASPVSFWDKIYRKDRAISRDRHRISYDGWIDWYSIERFLTKFPFHFDLFFFLTLIHHTRYVYYFLK